MKVTTTTKVERRLTKKDIESIITVLGIPLTAKSIVVTHFLNTGGCNRNFIGLTSINADESNTYELSYIESETEEST